MNRKRPDSDFTSPPRFKERPPKPSYHDILSGNKNKKASSQSKDFLSKSVKSGTQGKVRSESRPSNSKTSVKRPSLRLINETTYTPCDYERKELTETGA